MTDVKQAVRIAVEFVKELYEAEGIADVRLEEVERPENENRWMVTLSFTRPRPHPLGIPQVLLAGVNLSRDYKTLTISGADGTVESMRIRELASSKAE